jgi:crotonobetaine/carnitine-CoA ligase
LTHGNAQLLTFAPAMGLDCPVVFSRRFTKSRLWDITRQYGCTLFNLLGGMATAIYAEPVKPNDGDNPVRMVLSAGMPAAIWKAFETRFNVRIFEMYGAIEGGMAMNPPGVGPVGSFGKPPPNLEMKVFDDDGNECPPGVLGEIVSRPRDGTQPAVEYFRNPEASSRKTAWLAAFGRSVIPIRTAGSASTSQGWRHPPQRRLHQSGIRREGRRRAFVVTDGGTGSGERDVVAAVVAADGRRSIRRSAGARPTGPNFVPSYLQVVDEIPKTASEKPQEGSCSIASRRTAGCTLAEVVASR